MTDNDILIDDMEMLIFTGMLFRLRTLVPLVMPIITLGRVVILSAI